MGRLERTWTCHKQSKGEKCGHKNPRKKKLCQKCGKTRPPVKKPAHMAALEISYEEAIEINGGEFCAICGVTPQSHWKIQVLQKDHEHNNEFYYFRGLLCFRCNVALPDRLSPEWLRLAADYLERARARARS
jgi:hypothetical protein